MNTVIWVALIVMSPVILLALLVSIIGLVALAGAGICLMSEAWTSWRERHPRRRAT